MAMILMRQVHSKIELVCHDCQHQSNSSSFSMSSSLKSSRKRSSESLSKPFNKLMRMRKTMMMVARVIKPYHHKSIKVKKITCIVKIEAILTLA